MSEPLREALSTLAAESQRYIEDGSDPRDLATAIETAQELLALRVLPDSDAPTPREATPVDGLREALQDLPFSRQWPTQKPPGEWYVRVEDAISFMVEERAREAQAGSRSARSSTALQAAASTAAAGEGATLSDAVKDARARGQDIEPGWMDEEQATGDVDAAWEALYGEFAFQPVREAIARHRPLIEAAIRSSRATSETPRLDTFERGYAEGYDAGRMFEQHRASETPRETPLAAAGIDVDRLTVALWGQTWDGDAQRLARKIAAEYDRLAIRAAARGSE